MNTINNPTQGALTMNPSHSLQVPPLAHSFKHAGGWGKLGWHSLDVDQGLERTADLADDEDLEPDQYS